MLVLLERGDLVFVSELLRSLPLPRTVFLKDPFLLRDFWTPAIAVPLPDVRSSSAPSYLPGSLVVRRKVNFEKMFPETIRLCAPPPDDFFFP